MKAYSLALIITVSGIQFHVEASRRLRDGNGVDMIAKDGNEAYDASLVEETRQLLLLGNLDLWVPAMSMLPTLAPHPAPTRAPITASPTLSAVEVPTVTPTAAPVPLTPAPVAPTPAPIPVTPRPVATPAPIPLTPRPVATPAPIPLTPRPVATPAPQFPTRSPVAPTPVPVASPTSAPTTGAPGVVDRLLPFVINGGAEFDNPNSYQSIALRRVGQQVGVDFFTEAKLVQYYALYCIFAATNGVPNIITDADPRFADLATFPGWLLKNGWEEIDIDPCSGWDGVVCVNDVVTELILPDNLLTGIWPHEVTLLASDGPRGISGAGALETLDLTDNQFLFNNFDNSWMSLLGSAMVNLYIQATGFAGSLAPLPVNLVELDCSYTLIDGGLTNEVFSGLNNLSFALLDGNAFNTSIPTVFGSLPNLEFLFISDAFISGDLTYMRGMPKIVEHWVDLNPGMGGQIPAFIGNLTTLRSFSVTQSSLTGTLPSQLGLLADMLQMWLYANSLEGQIPSELGRLSGMKILQVEGNSIVGPVPSAICALRTFPITLEIFGTDCTETSCTCCTCCGLQSCNPMLFS